jgi:hypothetical protein
MKNILQENMKRFATKNLNEQQDGDANNNGYPDKTEKYQTLAQQRDLPGVPNPDIVKRSLNLIDKAADMAIKNPTGDVVALGNIIKRYVDDIRKSL